MTIPSTNQAIVTSMADLVLTAPGERVSVLGYLFQAIEDGLIVEGATDERRREFWYEAILMAKNFAVLGRGPE